MYCLLSLANMLHQIWFFSLLASFAPLQSVECSASSIERDRSIMSYPFCRTLSARSICWQYRLSTIIGLFQHYPRKSPCRYRQTFSSNAFINQVMMDSMKRKWYPKDHHHQWRRVLDWCFSAFLRMHLTPFERLPSYSKSIRV